MQSPSRILVCGAEGDRFDVPSAELHDSMGDLLESMDSLPQPAGDDQEPSLLLVFCLPKKDYAAALAEILALAERERSARRNTAFVILYHELTPRELVLCARRGVFDLVARGEGEAQFRSSVHKAVDSLQTRQDRLTLIAEQKSAQFKLMQSQKILREQIASTTTDLAVANHRLEMANEQLTVHMSQLSLLYSFGRELSNARNWDHALENLLENLAEFVGAGGAALLLRPAEDAPYMPRKTFQWQQSAWEETLRRIAKIQTEAENLGRRDTVFSIEGRDGAADRVTALPLEHRGLCLGYLLLLQMPAENESDYLPLLNALQLILSDEVAAAQMLDRMRELSIFNSRVLETVRSGIWVIDEMAHTVYCNRVAREMISGRTEDRVMETFKPGYGRGRTGGRVPVSEFFKQDTRHDADLPELFLDGLIQLDDSADLPLKVLAEAGDSGWQGEGNLRRSDGSRLPVLIQSARMSGRSRSEKWLVVVLEDQLEAKRAVAEKLRADKLQSLVEMSSTLAHEIRNPLMGLSAQAELLAENLPQEDSRRRYIDVITSEVERIDRTISSMLDFTRPYQPSREEVDLAALLQDCRTLAAPRAEARRVTIRVEDTEGKGPVLADGAQLKQVILNLVFNAVDASPEDGLVQVQANVGAELEIDSHETGLIRTARGTCITVSDQGAGFVDTDPEIIFRPFYTTKSAGTGLGLPTSRKIIEAHGGTLTADHRNKETRFVIQLPEAVDHVHTEKAEETR